MKLPSQATRSAQTEANRFRLVWERDSKHAAIEWARQTLEIYKRAITDPDHYATKTEYKPSFKASIVALEALLQMDAEGRLEEVFASSRAAGQED